MQRSIPKPHLRILSMVLAFILALSSAPAITSRANMKDQNFSFRLSPGKTVVVYKRVLGLKELKPFTVRISSLTRKQSGKTVTVKLKVVVNDSNKYTKEEVDKICKQFDRTAYYYTARDWNAEKWGACLLDYKTGKLASLRNDVSIKSETNGWEGFRTKVFKGHKGHKYKIDRRYYNTYTITFPSSYKNLCFGLYGSTNPKEKAEDFKMGYCSFAASGYSGKASRKKTSCWMRVQ